MGYFNLPVIFSLAFIVVAVVISGGFYTGFFAGPMGGAAVGGSVTEQIEEIVEDEDDATPLVPVDEDEEGEAEEPIVQNVAEFVSSISEQSFIWGWIIFGMAVCVGVIMFFAKSGSVVKGKPKKRRYGKK